MNQIKAFVGHSFTTDAAAVVGAFLKYFDQVEGLHPSFSWEHAEAAEPRELDLWSPKREWKLENYKRAMFDLIILDKPEEAAAVNAAYLATADAGIGDSKAEWEANTEYLRIAFGKGGSLDALKQMKAPEFRWLCRPQRWDTGSTLRKSYLVTELRE